VLAALNATTIPTNVKKVNDVEVTDGVLTTDQAAQLAALAKIHGLISGTPLVVSATARTAGDVSQTVDDVGGVVTVTRV
jgi:hypothetical protein